MIYIIFYLLKSQNNTPEDQSGGTNRRGVKSWNIRQSDQESRTAKTAAIECIQEDRTAGGLQMADMGATICHME